MKNAKGTLPLKAISEIKSVAVGVTLDEDTNNERNSIFKDLAVDVVELAAAVLRVHDGPPLRFFVPTEDELQSLPKWKPEFITAKTENRNELVQQSDRIPKQSKTTTNETRTNAQELVRSLPRD